MQESQLLEVVRRKPVKRLGSPDPDELSCDADSSPAVMLRKNNFNSSTKLNALCEDLGMLNFNDRCH